jgi:uncharacterized protein (TIGR02271 family)
MTNPKTDPLDVRDMSSEIEVIPLVEEELRLDKRTVTTGRVRIRTTAEVETELAKATLDGETVEVTRVPIDRMIDQAPDIRTEGDVTIIPVLEKILVVEKRLVLKEELHVRKRTTTEEVEVPVELRKQRAIVEHIPVDEDETNTST